MKFRNFPLKEEALINLRVINYGKRMRLKISINHLQLIADWNLIILKWEKKIVCGIKNENNSLCD